ncbi:MAG: HAD hydrolase-like protein [Maritimibacter sp.]|nr:HAD hydrolase-like protein [Maritimibacter sp.]
MTPVFLDLDGTLTDPRPGITRSIVHALVEMGHDAPDPDSLTWAIGPALIDSFARLGVAEPEVALGHYRARYTAVGLFENRVYSGIPEALAQMRDAGHRLFVATAKPHAYARRITAHFGLAQYFEAEFGPELDGTRNDKAELLAFARETLGLGAAHAVMVGDRMHDHRAAHAAGMAALAVRWGYGDDSEHSEADAICDTPHGLAEAVRQLADLG